MENDRGLKKKRYLCVADQTLENDRGISKFERTYCEQHFLTELHGHSIGAAEVLGHEHQPHESAHLVPQLSLDRRARGRAARGEPPPVAALPVTPGGWASTLDLRRAWGRQTQSLAPRCQVAYYRDPTDRYRKHKRAN